jgi:hypothetical protein
MNGAMFAMDEEEGPIDSSSSRTRKKKKRGRGNVCIIVSILSAMMVVVDKLLDSALCDSAGPCEKWSLVLRAAAVVAIDDDKGRRPPMDNSISGSGTT